ncbi:hypothetical protein OG331_05855 [Streptomyces sp. NBC_01017]|uniref:hypothetical protein n=1 Tax=Streptomyces sp. NBC_01017 TaxID=2903721 RepID=UPI00386CED5F|nr:hypothetical protein OG331_05855 [Streptomyces sp. NBC_01017]
MASSGVQHAVRGAQLLPCCVAAAFQAQPFAVQQMGASEVDVHPGLAQVSDGFTVSALFRVAFVQ